MLFLRLGSRRSHSSLRTILAHGKDTVSQEIALMHDTLRWFEEGGAMEGQENGLGGLVELRTCNKCRPRTFKSFQEIAEIVRPWVEEGQGKRLAAEVVLERARARQQVKTEELKYVVGPRRRELIRLLEEELHVAKTAYQGGTYVGNHVSKMLENHEKLSVVLASKPTRLYLLPAAEPYQSITAWR